jgi:hypothetical protein
MRTVLMRWSAPPQRSASRAGTPAPCPVCARPVPGAQRFLVHGLDDGGGDPARGRQGPVQAQPGQRVQQCVVAPLPRGAPVLDLAGLGRGGGEGVEHAEQSFRALGGEFAAHGG